METLNKLNEIVVRTTEAIDAHNDSPARSFLTVATLGTLGVLVGMNIDHSTSIPTNFMTGHSADLVGSAAQTALYGRIVSKESHVILPMAMQLWANGVWEVMQQYHIMPGTFDVWDFCRIYGRSTFVVRV